MVSLVYPEPAEGNHRDDVLARRSALQHAGVAISIICLILLWDCHAEFTLSGA